MPEPYPFPPLPTEPFTFNDPKLQPVRLGVEGEIPLVMTPPTPESNHIGFFLHGRRELFRFALVVNDAGEVVSITEDGREISVQEMSRLAFKIVLGEERYEKVKHVLS